jgi:hypothetical protein
LLGEQPPGATDSAVNIENATNRARVLPGATAENLAPLPMTLIANPL